MGAASDLARFMSSQMRQQQLESLVRTIGTDTTRLLRYMGKDQQTPSFNNGATPNVGSGGLIRAILDDDLEFGSTAAATRQDTFASITVSDWDLSEDETVGSGSRIWVKEEGGAFYYVTGQCSVDS